MFFRVEITVSDLFLTPASELSQIRYPIVIEYPGKPHITVELRPANEEERARYKEDVAFCTACGEYQPAEEVVTALECVASGALPRGSDPDKASHALEDGTTSKLKPNHLPPLASLPEPVQSFVTYVRDDLWDHGRRTVRVARWRRGTENPHSPFASRGTFWSSDGVQWHSLPGNWKVYVSDRGSLSLRSRDIEFIRDAVHNAGDEPIGHELLREAWHHRHQNPRSALILGVTALEVGFKAFVANSNELAGWVLQEVQSPPVEKLLRESLPKVVPGAQLPEELLDVIRKGVARRNLTVHREVAPPEREFVERVLLAVRDSLWLLDVYGGERWALDHVREETRAKLPSGFHLKPA